MLKKLRKKFIINTMFLVGSVVIIAVVIICIYYGISSRNELISYMQTQAEQYTIPSGNSDMKNQDDHNVSKPSQSIVTQVYLLSYSESSDSLIPVSKDITISDEIISAARTAATSDSLTGDITGSIYIYTKIIAADKQQGNIIAIADASYLASGERQMIVTSLLFAAMFMIIMFFISILLAKIAMKPAEEAWNKQKQFIADASHELKTPLTVIIANNRIIRSHPGESVAKQEEWLDSTEEETTHMKSLIDDMLTLASSEENESNMTKTSVDLTKAVKRIVLQFDAVSFEKKITILSDISEGLKIEGDESKLRQLFMILIDNAIKYEPAGGSIKVVLSKEHKNIKYSVTNNGSVISQNDLIHIFDRFYRADHSRSTEGYGLGLSIAKNIAELHGGSISAESSEESGTCFTVILPVI
jgi:two-component system sensor histidine kinase CiaH